MSAGNPILSGKAYAPTLPEPAAVAGNSAPGIPGAKGKTTKVKKGKKSKPANKVVLKVPTVAGGPAPGVKQSVKPGMAALMGGM